MSWSPVSSSWNNQISADGGEIFYEFNPDIWTVFGVIARKDSDAVKEKLNPDIQNFLHLRHSIENNYVK